MSDTRVLFVSGSLGLGHVSRDLAIVEQMRRLDPSVDVRWLAAEPATTMLVTAGEALLPEVDEWAAETAAAESVAGEYSSSIFKYVIRAYAGMDRNAVVFERVVARERFDVVVGDETYELWEPLVKKPTLLSCPYVMIYDFIGFDPRGGGLIERFGSYYFNRLWVGSDKKLFAEEPNRALFVGEPEDIPDAGLGPLLPNRRTHAREHYRFVGYTLSFDPAAYADRDEVRRALGYDDAPTIVVAIGGTSIGKALLELCAETFPLIRAQVPDVRMVLVSGPRVEPNSVRIPAGMDGQLRVEGYVPRLYEHLAACDLAIVQGGGTTTLELTALKRPFLYFPLHGHFEQEVAVSERLDRHGAGTRMSFSATTPELLAEAALAHLGREVAPAAIRTQGALEAAREILEAATGRTHSAH